MKLGRTIFTRNSRPTGMPLLFAICAMAVLLSGCCGHFRCARNHKIAPVPSEVAKEFSRPSVREADVRETRVHTNEYHLETQFELIAVTNGPSSSRALVLDCFLPTRTTNPPVILILPMLGGKYPLERFFAKYFARHGLASVIVHREDTDGTPETADAVNTLFHQTVLDNKRAIDWLQTRHEVDASRLGVFGVSMGAIKGALLTP